MLSHGQASIAVCGPDIGRHKQCGKVVFFSPTADHHSLFIYTVACRSTYGLIINGFCYYSITYFTAI